MVGRSVRRALGVAVVAGAVAGGASAASIAVPNGSFEAPDARTPFGVSTKIDNWTTYGEAPFDTGGGPASSGTGVFRNVNPDDSVNFDNATGAQVAYIFTKASVPTNRVGLEQVLAATYQAGTAYAVRVDVGLAGSSPGANDPFTFQLFAVDPANPGVRTVVATRTVVNDGGASNPLSKTHLNEYLAVSPVLTAADTAIVGRRIGIEIFTAAGSDPNAVAGRQYDFDNVRVDTPEPAAAGELAFAVVAALGRRRRRRVDAARGRRS
jgi:hypothetical protein